MKRRLAVLVVLALAFAGCSDSGDDSSDGVGDASAPGDEWDPKPGVLDFTEPNQVMAGPDGNVEVTLDAAALAIDVSGDQLEATPYAATVGATRLPVQINGPTIHVSPSGTIRVTIKNDLTQLTNIHYHGLHVSPNDNSDNVFREMSPGKGPGTDGSYLSVVNLRDPKTGLDHPSGTYWYHVHQHGNSAMQVNGGLSGMLIVEGSEQAVVPPFLGKQVQLALRDITTRAGGVDPAGTKKRLVNGIYAPKMSIGQGETQLWRIANIGANTFSYLELEGHQFTVVAQDGNTLFDGASTTVSRLDMGTGKRYDVLVTGGMPRPGGEPYLLKSTDYDPGLYKPDPTKTPDPNPVFTVASVTVQASANPSVAGSAQVTLDAPEDGLRAVRTDITQGPNRTFTFERVPTIAVVPATTTSTTVVPDNQIGVCPPPAATPTVDWHWGINGQRFDHTRTDVAVQMNTAETWTLCNTTDAEHPFHIHVNEFVVETVNGVAYKGPAGYQDIIIIPASHMDDNTNTMVAGQVVIENIYRDFPGWFVFHCHILAHEDDGMMQSIQVLGEGESPSPPKIKTD